MCQVMKFDAFCAWYCGGWVGAVVRWCCQGSFRVVCGRIILRFFTGGREEIVSPSPGGRGQGGISFRPRLPWEGSAGCRGFLVLMRTLLLSIHGVIMMTLILLIVMVPLGF